MKIGVVAPTAVPYVFGGAERLHGGLTAALREQGHDARLIEVGSRESNLQELVETYESFSKLDVSAFDLVITGKYPAWMIEHPNHVVYMLHALRGLYDTYHVFQQPLEGTYQDKAVSGFREWLDQDLTRVDLPALFDRCRELIQRLGIDHQVLRFPGPLARTIVHKLDQIGLSRSSVSRYFAISNTVACRREYFPTGAPVSVLHPPSDMIGLAAGDYRYMFTSGRLDSPKRIQLLIEAMGYVGTDIQLKIAGTGPLDQELRMKAADDDRIEMLGHIPTSELIEHYSQALAVPFIPYDEDLGLVVWEAMMSAKPVVTCYDSGGSTELVASGSTGIVTDPTPGQIGRAIDWLCANPDKARAMGELGRSRARGISWERVVRGLVPPATGKPRPSASTSVRPKVVVLSTYPIWPARAGGQLRGAHLYRALAKSVDVTVVCLSNSGPQVSKAQIEDGVQQIAVRKSREHRVGEVEMSELAGIPVEDIAASELISATPAFKETLQTSLEGARALIHAHPYLVPLTSEVQLPVIYDAIDVEYMLKESLLSKGEEAEPFHRAVAESEAAAWRSASIVFAASSEDLVALTSRYGQTNAVKTVVPNGVDLRRIRFTPWQERTRRRDRWLQAVGAEGCRVATFIGSWHPPNLDAGDHIRDMASGFQSMIFLLAGGHSEHYRDKWVPPNVYLLGRISNAAKSAILSVADVGLNPMTRGSGTNLKVIEYFAAGLPVLSTPKGIRGIQVTPDVEAKVADLEGFEAALEEMFQNELRTELMAVAARRLAERYFNWESLGERFAAGVLGVIDSA